MVTLAARGDEIHVDELGVMNVESSKPMRRDTIFRIAAMTKSVVAVAMLILLEEGAPPIDDQLSRGCRSLRT